MAAGRGRISNRKKKEHILEYILGFILMIGVLAPVYWMFMTSVMNAKELTSKPLPLFTLDVTFERYLSVFRDRNTSSPSYIFRVAVGNSLYVAVVVTILALAAGMLAAYAFARLRFHGRNQLMLLILFTYMLPPVAFIIPMYVIFSRLHLLDQRGSLILLYLSFIIPFIVWVMQGFFGTISKSYEEAAEIDGANKMQIFLYIFLPMARPGVIATGILAFLMSWDEFFYSLVFTSSLRSKTMPVAISEFNGKYTIDYGMISVAGILGSLIPVLITIIFQKYIVLGMTSGGVKE